MEIPLSQVPHLPPFRPPPACFHGRGWWCPPSLLPSRRRLFLRQEGNVLRCFPLVRLGVRPRPLPPLSGRPCPRRIPTCSRRARPEKAREAEEVRRVALFSSSLSRIQQAFHIGSVTIITVVVFFTEEGNLFLFFRESSAWSSRSVFLCFPCCYVVFPSTMHDSFPF